MHKLKTFVLFCHLAKQKWLDRPVRVTRDVYPMRLKGVTFGDKQRKIRFTNRMDRLMFVNQAVESDSNAVSVINGKKEVIGWVDKSRALKIKRLNELGRVSICRWHKIGGGRLTTGVLIHVEELNVG